MILRGMGCGNAGTLGWGILDMGLYDRRGVEGLIDKDVSSSSLTVWSELSAPVLASRISTFPKVLFLST